MNPQVFPFADQLAGAAGLLFLALSLFLGVLALLLPFFVWRISKWSRSTCQEVARLNAKVEQLLASMQAPSPIGASAEEERIEAAEATAEEPEAEEESPPSPPDEEPHSEPVYQAKEVTSHEVEPTGLETEVEEEVEETEAPRPTIEGEEKTAETWEDEPQAVEEEIFAAAVADDMFAPAAAEESNDKAPSQEEVPEMRAALAAGATDIFSTGMAQESTAVPASPPSEEIPFASREESEAAAAQAVEEEPPEDQSPGIPPKPETLMARCQGCGHKLAYRQTLSGKRVRCPACKAIFTLA